MITIYEKGLCQMSKAILLSTKPKYVADILNGKKIIEIRKQMPKCDLPIDVYIYCTKNGETLTYLVNGKNEIVDFTTVSKNNKYIKRNYNGKVVAKFTLRKVEEIETSRNEPFMLGCYKTKTMYEPELLRLSCLGFRELDNYLRYKNGCAWHIEDLVIFDKPKELSEFRKPSTLSLKQLQEFGLPYDEKTYKEMATKGKRFITKAPQNYCFVEV